MPTAREDATRLADLLRREHRALSEFLVALAAFDAERRWGELGHTSLFHFLVRELGLPNGPAYYRKTAAELIQRYPEIVEPLRDGRLHLTSLVEVSRVITPENRAEILPRFFHTSKREAKEVAAAIRPAEAPPLRTVVTAVRAPSPALAGQSPVAPERPASAADPLASPPGPSLALLPEEPDPCQPDVPDVAPAPARRRAEVEPVTADLRRIHLTVSRRLLDKLAAARDALSHSHPGASDDEILEVALDLVVERHRKRRGIGAKPRKSRATADANPEGAGAAPPAPAKRSRHVPAAVWRAVWERDGGRCAWPIEGGGICGSTYQLELDHVNGFALGAGTTVDETRLLCRTHQDVSARRLYGDDHMNAFTRPKGGRCSEPVAAYGGGSGSGSRSRSGSRSGSGSPGSLATTGEPASGSRPDAPAGTSNVLSSHATPAGRPLGSPVAPARRGPAPFRGPRPHSRTGCAAGR